MSYLYDPQVEQPNTLGVDEVDEGVFFICDQDGPISVSHSLCDAGPYSVRFDAQRELDRFKRSLEGWY
jgi:hypothetical protein